MHGVKPEKSILTYEHVILQTLNFNIRPPFPLITKHMGSLLRMIDKSLKEYLDEDTYKQYTD